jgi:phenylpropionate dioxygenase-like ring-hydroxylating dioxygenase large terminal subunit
MSLHRSIVPGAAEIAENAARPFELASAMPKSVYTSPDFTALELETIFSKEWLCAGRADSLKGPGNYLTMEIAGEPIIVLRDRDNRLRAMSNVCRHRMSTLLQGSGTVRAIVCPYHAWTYNLDGTLRGAPAMGKNETFHRDEICLPAVRCEEWLGWIMVTLDAQAAPPSQKLKAVEDLVGYLDMGAYTETFRETHRWDTNWKVLAENFMESYHLPVCHAGTIGGSTDLNTMVCPEGTDTFNYHTILRNDQVKLCLAHPDNTTLVDDQRRTTWLLAIYPSLLITLTPGYFWYLSLQPHGPGQVDIIFGGGMSPDYMADAEAPDQLAAVKKMLDLVNVEDRGCTEKVFKGLNAHLAAPGPLSHLERPNFEFAQYIARRVNMQQT